MIVKIDTNRGANLMIELLLLTAQIREAVTDAMVDPLTLSSRMPGPQNTNS